MKQKYTVALATVFSLAALFPLCVTAQSHKTKLPPQQKQHVLVNAHNHSSSNYETLSGIHLYKMGKGAFRLDFSQNLKENAVLSIMNTARQVVYHKAVSIMDNTSTWRYNLGKLKPDTYLVEVKTSDTTYWTKFKIGK